MCNKSRDLFQQIKEIICVQIMLISERFEYKLKKRNVLICNNKVSINFKNIKNSKICNLLSIKDDQ